MFQEPDLTQSAATVYLRQRCRNDPAGDLMTFLKDRPQLSDREVLDVILTDQRVRWEHGSGKTVDEYLNEFPMIADDSNLVMDLVYGDWLARGKIGAISVPERISKCYPDINAKISKQQEVYDWLTSEAVRLVQTNEIIVPQNNVSEDDLDSSSNTRVEQRNPEGRVGWKLMLAALAASLLFMVIFDLPGLFQRTNAPNEIPFRSGPLSWSLEAYRSGDLDQVDRITSTPAALHFGDAFRLSVRPAKASYLYLYTIDPKGKVTFVEELSELQPNHQYDYPRDAEKAISVPSIEGTMLCVIVQRDRPMVDAGQLAEQLKLSEPLPELDPATLLVDGAMLESRKHPSILNDIDGDDGISLDKIHQRLGSQYASRSIGPANPNGDAVFAEAIKAWYKQIPRSVGDIHYLAIPVVSNSK